jgi:hypothetical protein
MAFNGNTKDFSPIQVFNLIRLTLKTGKLIFSGSYSVELFFSEGQLIYATRLTDDQDLLQTLQQAGRLNEIQVELIRKQTTDLDVCWLSSWLLEAGYVTKIDLAESVHRQILHTVYQTILQAEGQFKFQEGLLPSLDVPITAVDLREVIDQGDRLLKEWDELKTAVPDLGIYMQATDQLTPAAGRLLMNKTEWLVATACNAQRTLRQIAQTLNLDDFQMRRIVRNLLKIEMVEIVAPKRADTPNTLSVKPTAPSNFEAALQNIRSGLQQQLVHSV